MKKSIPVHIRYMFLILLLLSAINIANSCTKIPGPNEIFIQGMAFSPSTITVSAGTTITWINKDGVAHTVTSTTGLFDSGSLSKNEQFSHTFGTAGTFAYKCIFHPTMTASVIVN